MTRFLTYTRLRSKAAFRVLPALLLLVGLLALTLTVLLTAASSAQTDGNAPSVRLSIGIVGTDTSSYLDTGLALIKTLDSSRAAVELTAYDTQEAAAADLRRGKLSAVIVIPEGLVDSLLAGGSGKLALLLPGSNAGIGALLIRALSSVLSSIISEMKAASSALKDFLRLRGVEDIDVINSVQTDLLLGSLTAVLHRSSLFQVQETDAGTTLPLESYYLIALLLLLLLLSGLVCAGTYIRSGEELNRLLALRGLSPAGQVCAELISLFALLSAAFALLLPPAALALDRLPLTFTAFSGSGRAFVPAFLHFSLHLIPAALLAASLNLLLFELAKSPLSGIPVLTLTLLALAYLSGLFYPVSSLPSVLQRTARFLPTGQALLYLQADAAGRRPEMLLHLLAMLGFVLLFFVLTVCVRRRRLAAPGGGAR